MESGDPSLLGTRGQEIHRGAKPPFPEALCVPDHAALRHGDNQSLARKQQ